ncbi:Uncharacterised protein [Dorea longicatena]|nr:Uncharacterised protein [Dorea longicatena]
MVEVFFFEADFFLVLCFPAVLLVPAVLFAEVVTAGTVNLFTTVRMAARTRNINPIRINTMAMINKIRCICRLRLLRALFFFASLIPLILFLLYFKILSVFQTTKTTVHCRNGLSDLSIQKGLVQIFASFHIYVSKIFFACTDADIEFNFTFFGNLFQAVNKCWNIIQ